MRQPTVPLVLLLLLLHATAPVAAQRVVSPAALASAEGNAANSYPFQLTGRYQQVHGDLRGQPLRVTGLEFRRDGLQAASIPARRLDCEIWASEGSYALFSPVFDRNHGAAPQQVMARRWVDLPELTTTPQTPPAPFRVALPFDVPFTYGGVGDLVWELRLHANTVTTLPYHCDAYRAGTDTDVNTGPVTAQGRGCTVSGNTQSMQAGAQVRTFHQANQITVSLWAVHGPRSQPSLLWLGSEPIDLAIPGLCTSFRVGGAAILLPGVTDAAGTHFLRIAVPFQMGLVNVRAVHQVLTLDPARPGPLPFSGSDLAIWTIPARPATGGAVRVARVWPGQLTTAPFGSMDAGNYSLVTGFMR